MENEITLTEESKAVKRHVTLEEFIEKKTIFYSKSMGLIKLLHEKRKLPYPIGEENIEIPEEIWAKFGTDSLRDFCLRCPKDLDVFIEPIKTAALKYIASKKSFVSNDLREFSENFSSSYILSDFILTEYETAYAARPKKLAVETAL